MAYLTNQKFSLPLDRDQVAQNWGQRGYFCYVFTGPLTDSCPAVPRRLASLSSRSKFPGKQGRETPEQRQLLQT